MIELNECERRHTIIKAEFEEDRCQMFLTSISKRIAVKGPEVSSMWC